jgi:ferric-dicitrate binding protein FerR (iron transport regulator)
VVKKDLKNEIATTTTTKNKPFKNDVPPGGDKAVLTLADGSTIVLDDAQNGNLTQQGNTKVIKLNGKLAYDPAKAGAGEIVYNTISTPRGGKYQIELPDGTQVWLNAASSLHFPTAFIGRERKVEITGEAYFEVAPLTPKGGQKIPFIVSVNGSEIEVLGTHFNVMAYSDEDAVKTTLLEGSVKFVNGNNTSLLKPGQQSQLLRNGQVKVVSDVDVENVISWKNGMFQFENADMETVMRQLSRWYDVEVVFKSKKLHDPLHVEIPFNTNLSDALKILEEAGTAKFEIEGKRIIVIQ